MRCIKVNSGILGTDVSPLPEKWGNSGETWGNNFPQTDAITTDTVADINPK